MPFAKVVRVWVIELSVYVVTYVKEDPSTPLSIWSSYNIILLPPLSDDSLNPSWIELPVALIKIGEGGAEGTVAAKI